MLWKAVALLIAIGVIALLLKLVKLALYLLLLGVVALAAIQFFRRWFPASKS